MAFKKEDLRIGDVLEYNIAETPEAPDWVDCTIDWEDLKWLTENPESFNLFHRKKETSLLDEDSCLDYSDYSEYDSDNTSISSITFKN